jgi:hypothetical protein
MDTGPGEKLWAHVRLLDIEATALHLLRIWDAAGVLALCCRSADGAVPLLRAVEDLRQAVRADNDGRELPPIPPAVQPAGGQHSAYSDGSG